MINLNQTWIEIECPKCGYQDQIQLIDAKTEKTILQQANPEQSSKLKLQRMN